MKRKLEMQCHEYREVNLAEIQSREVSISTSATEWGKASTPTPQIPAQIPGLKRTLTTRKGVSVETTYTDEEAKVKLLQYEDSRKLRMTPFVQSMCDRVRVEFVRFGKLPSNTLTSTAADLPYQRISLEQAIWIHVLVVEADKRNP